MRLESFERFIAANPNGQVLQPSTKHQRNYGLNPYAGYDSEDGPYSFLFNGDLPTDINPMARVVAVREGDQNLAVALTFLREKGTIQLGDIKMTWTGGQNSALDTRTIAQGRDIGNIIVQRQTTSGLQDVVYDVTFAFVVYAFYPDLVIKQD